MRCSIKSLYATEKVAQLAADRMMARHPRYAFAAYPCDEHDAWHVGRTGTTAEAEHQRQVAHEVEIAEAIVRLKEARGW